MGSTCSSASASNQLISLHSLSPFSSGHRSECASSSVRDSSICSICESYNSDGSGFQVYPHYSAVYEGVQSRNTTVISPTKSVKTALKVVEPVMCRIPSIADFSPVWKQMITGQLNPSLLERSHVLRSEGRTIYIYHCANYGDSVEERRVLHDKVYPRLTEYCGDRGVTLEVIDLTLGVSHYSHHGHACKKMSQKVLADLTAQKGDCTIVTIFFNDNDPAYSYPLQIRKDDFHLMLKKCTHDEKLFLLTCYKLDDTVTEHSYVVQDFNPKEGEKIHIRLRNIISAASPPDFQRHQHVSDVERDLKITDMDQDSKFKEKIWVRRNFTDIDWDQLSPKGYSMYYTEDSCSMKKTNFTEVLSNIFKSKDVIQSEVKWCTEGIDPNLEEHRSYLDNMASNYHKMIVPKLDEMMDSFAELDKQKIRLRSKGLTDCLYSDLLQQTPHTLRLQQTVLGQNDLMDALESYLTEDGLHGDKLMSQPLLVRGPPGSGKSALAAVLANNVHGVAGWKNSCCVMRSARVSRECVTLEQMVYSVCEQLCLLSGLPVNLVYQQGSNILHELLESSAPRIFRSPHLLIILDGVDQLDTVQQTGGFSDGSWLPTSLPKHVRMVLTATTNSQMAKTIQMQLPESNIKDLPKLFMADAMLCFSENIYNSANRFLMPSDQEKVMQIMKNKPSPLFIELLCSLIHFQPDLLCDLDESLGTDCEQLVQRFLCKIEECFGVESVSYICCLLLVSRHGVSIVDLNTLCQTHQSHCGSPNNYEELTVPLQVDQVSIYSIIHVLKPFLRNRTNQGATLIAWKYPLFEKVLRIRYGALFLKMAEQELRSYFKKLYDGRNHDGDEDLCRSSTQDEIPLPVYLRAIDELPYAYHHSQNHAELLKLLTSPSFATRKIQHCGLQHLIMDLCLLLHQTVTPSEVQHINDFKSLLQTVRPAIVFNTSAIDVHFRNYSLFCKKQQDSNNPFQQILQKPNEDSRPRLKAKATVKNFTYGYQNHLQTAYNFSGLFRMKGDTDHVIALATDNGELQVINIHTGEPHRILRGLDKPRTVRTINMFEVVVLCDREMRIYNVDQGTLVCTLRGVLNLSLPCFEVQSDQHTMALSRNRMHINMYNNSTGDVFTTFKVGEDRFLNSLLVSENGEFCVCGDEVRKPFPLLVWDLKHCKLIHDLRISGHEFITRLSALTKDGSLLVCACHEVENLEPNFLLVYEVQNGSMFTKFQTDFSCTAVAISKEAGHVVAVYENGDILVWHLNDTVRTSPKFRLEGHTLGVDKLVLCDDGTRGVTYDSTGKDTFIWMWDFKLGIALGCIEAMVSPSSCEISADGQTTIVCYPGLDQILTFSPSDSTQSEPNPNSVYGDASRKGDVFTFKHNQSI